MKTAKNLILLLSTALLSPTAFSQIPAPQSGVNLPSANESNEIKSNQLKTRQNGQGKTRLQTIDPRTGVAPSTEGYPNYQSPQVSVGLEIPIDESNPRPEIKKSSLVKMR